MAISEEESKKIKEHLLGQLSQFPEDKREQITKEINSMTNEQIENFVKENNLTHLGENECIFCSIVSGQNPSYKIAEDNKNLAILELNPLSKGHTLIVPKDHSQEIDKKSNFVEIVQKKLEERLGTKEFQKNNLKIMDHQILELIPIYGNEKERHPATKKELEEIQEEILRQQIVPSELDGSMPSAPEKIIQKLKPRIP